MPTIQPGSPAPDFQLSDQSGEQVSLGDLLRGGPVALFFYPAADTPGCTMEACHFRDLDAEFAAVGAQRVGISTDSVVSQRKFADRYNLDYRLLADVDASVAGAFGVKRGLLSAISPVKRATFVIGTDGIVKAVFSSELNMNAHADQALEALRKLEDPRAAE